MLRLPVDQSRQQPAQLSSGDSFPGRDFERPDDAAPLDRRVDSADSVAHNQSNGHGYDKTRIPSVNLQFVLGSSSGLA